MNERTGKSKTSTQKSQIVKVDSKSRSKPMIKIVFLRIINRIFGVRWCVKAHY